MKGTYDKMKELNFVNKLVSHNYRQWIEDFAKGNDCYPQIIELDPTSRCMYLCECCINSDIINKTEPIKKDEIIKFVDEFCEFGGKGIIFIGGGEPLMYPNIGDIFEYVYQKGIKIGITTNGLLIDKYINEISRYAQWTRVSIDAASEQMYQKVRPCKYKDAYKRVLENCKKLVSVKRGTLGFSFLIVENEHYCNVDEIFSAALLAKQIGFDYFEIKPMVDENHFLYKYTTDTLEKAFAQLDEALYLNDDRFQVIYPKSLKKYNEDSLLQDKKYSTCPVMKLRCVVTNHGIYPCPYKRGYQKFNMGSISDGYEKFVHSDKYKKVLKELNPERDCRFFCIRNDINNMLDMVKNGQIDYKKLDYTENSDVFV